MKTQKTLKALGIHPTLFFHGTEKAIEEAERKESERMQEVEKIIYSSDFIAMRYINGWGQQVILHRSTRAGVQFQISYIDSDGIPAMHENYICTAESHVDEAIHTKDELLRHYMHNSNRHDLQLEILTREAA